MIRFQKLRKEGSFDDFVHVIAWDSFLKIGEERFFFGSLVERTEEEANREADEWIKNYQKYKYGEFVKNA